MKVGFYVERRAFHRIKLNKPMPSSLRIVELNGLPLLSNRTVINILDLSFWGIEFSSHLYFPIHEDVIYAVDLPFHTKTEAVGKIVRIKGKGSYYSYGMTYIYTPINYICCIEEWLA